MNWEIGIDIYTLLCIKQVTNEKEMEPDPNILAWKIPWTEEPGGLQFTGLQRVRHDRPHMHVSFAMEQWKPTELM